MNEDYNFLKSKLLFLEALVKEFLETSGEEFVIDDFVMSEGHSIPSEDLYNFLKIIEAEGAITIIDSSTTTNKFIDCPLKIYELKLDKVKLFKLIENTKDKIYGKVEIYFDDSSSILYLNNWKIDFNLRNAGSNQKDLCRLLMKNKESVSKEWSCDEVLEAWGWGNDRIYDRNHRFLASNRTIIYRAAKDLNSRIMTLTDGRVNRLFEYDTKEVSINKKYRDCIRF